MHHVGTDFFKESIKFKKTLNIFCKRNITLEQKTTINASLLLPQFLRQQAISPQNNGHLKLLFGQVGGKVKDIALRATPIAFSYDIENFSFHVCVVVYTHLYDYRIPPPDARPFCRGPAFLHTRPVAVAVPARI